MNNLETSPSGRTPADLCQTAPAGCAYQLNDVVTYTNEFGVVFAGLQVIGFSNDDNEVKIHLNGSGWWAGVSESSLAPEKEPLYAFRDNEDMVRFGDAWFSKLRCDAAKPIDQNELIALIGGQEPWDRFVGSAVQNGYRVVGCCSSYLPSLHKGEDQKLTHLCVYVSIERPDVESEEDELQKHDIIFAVGPHWSGEAPA